MKNLKKVLALVTMFTMLLSVAVSAGTLYPDVDDNASYAGAVETLNALGIMIGDENGNFNPDASITRAETAAIITRMKALGTAASAAGGTNFSDVAADHWAAGYINLAEQSGIINGYGDGTFGPSDAVTYEQVIKMIVAGLGYTPEADTKGGYPSGYMIIAANRNITKGVSVTPGAEAPRAAVARMVYNALDVPVMEQVSFKKGEEEFAAQDGGRYPLKTLLKDYLKVDKYEGIVADTYLTSGNDVEDDFIKLTLNSINGDDSFAGETESFAEGKTNAAALFGYWVEAYAAEDEDSGELTLLGITKKTGKNSELVIDYSQFEEAIYDGDDLVRIEYFANDTDASTTKIDIAAKVAYYFNGRKAATEVADFIDDLENDVLAFGALTLIDNDNDDEYEIIMLMQETANYVVAEVNASAKALLAKDGSNIDIDVDDETVITKLFKADGTVAEFADIKEGDVLTTYENGNLVTVYISDAKATGAVKEEIPAASGDNGYVIEGETYRLAYDGIAPIVTVAVGDEGTFFLNASGRIVAKEATSASGTYAFLYNAAVTKDINGTVVEMKFLTSEGKWETATLANKVTAIVDGVNAGSITPCPTADGTEDAFAPLFTIAKSGTEYTLTMGGVENRLFQYQTNSAGKINRLYILDSNAGKDDDAIFSLDMTQTDKVYKASQKKLGNIYFSEETKVFSVGDTIEDEDDITLTKVSTLFQDDMEYEKVAAYDIVNGIPSIAIAYNATTDIVEGTRLLLVTKVSEITNANGTRITKIYGYQEGKEVSGEYAEDGCTIKDRYGDAYGADVKAGDVVIFSLDADNAINKIQVLMTNAEAKAIIAGEGAAFVEANGDYSRDIFGFAQSRKNARFTLAENWEAGSTALTEDDGETNLAVSISGSKINVYEVNLNRSTPSYQVASAGDIDCETRAGKDAHWIYVREYDESVVDVVIYRVTNPVEVVEEEEVPPVEEGTEDEGSSELE